MTDFKMVRVYGQNDANNPDPGSSGDDSGIDPNTPGDRNSQTAAV